jgi:hypothetical protein
VLTKRHIKHLLVTLVYDITQEGNSLV